MLNKLRYVSGVLCRWHSSEWKQLLLVTGEDLLLVYNGLN